MTADTHVKLIRFADEGFLIKPYNTDFKYGVRRNYCHSFPFIDFEVTNLEDTDGIVDIEKVTKPKINDEQWSGCFAFLNTFDERLFENAMSFRKEDKKNIGYLLNNPDEIVWVRNTSHKGQRISYISRTNEYFPEHNQSIEDYFSDLGHLYWVKMKLGLALERIELGQKHLNWTPEWLSEVYLTKDQVKRLKLSTSNNFFINLKNKLIKN